LCANQKDQALEYLQSNVSKVVNHNYPDESQSFRELALFLFQWQGEVEVDEDLVSCGMAVDECSVVTGIFLLIRSFCFKN
jgi:hypothetical protein